MLTVQPSLPPTPTLEQHQQFKLISLCCISMRDNRQKYRKICSCMSTASSSGSSQEPHLVLRACILGATDLFPNTMLSSSRTVFSFTCSSFRLSEASESSYIHVVARSDCCLSLFHIPPLSLLEPYPNTSSSLTGPYPKAFSSFLGLYLNVCSSLLGPPPTHKSNSPSYHNG